MFWDKTNKVHNQKLDSQMAEASKKYKEVFGTINRKWVLKDLAKRCSVYNTTYNDNHGQMSFAEGRRSIYMYIQSIINKDLTNVLEELISGNEAADKQKE